VRSALRVAPASSRVLVMTLAAWLALAILAGATGQVALLQPPAPQVVLASLTILGLIATRFWTPVSAWASSVDVRVLVAWHVCRFVGFYFIHLGGRGELPETFAFPAGVGDAAVATLASVLLITGPPEVARLRIAYLAWNVFGLCDILFVVASAASHGLADPLSMHAMLVLPLSLLPTFIVPLIIVSHVVIFNRLRQPVRA
jgi:hypothetical protein